MYAHGPYCMLIDLTITYALRAIKKLQAQNQLEYNRLPE